MMKRSLEDIRRQYDEKRASSSSNDLASDQAINADESAPKLNVAPKEEERSGPEFWKPHNQLPPTADFSTIDFPSSVIASDLAQLYRNETVFNVFSESQCNSSLKSCGAGLELSADENSIQLTNVDFSKTDLSSNFADNNSTALYSNKSLVNLFPRSMTEGKGNELMVRQLDQFERTYESDSLPNVHNIFPSIETLLPVIPEEKQESDVLHNPIVSPTIDSFPAGNDEQGIETNPTSLTAGDKALPLDELPIKSANVANHCVEPVTCALPKPKDYLDHNWHFQKNKTIRSLVLGTSGCYYEGEVRDSKMHGHGRFYFGENQYISALWEKNRLIEPQASVLTMKSSRSPHLKDTFTIFKSLYFYLFSVHASHGHNTVFKAIPTTFEELDFNESVDNLKASFLERFETVEMIHEDRMRNKPLEEFEVALQVLSSKEDDVVKNATMLFFLRKFTNVYSTRSVLGDIHENDIFPSSLRAAAANLDSFEHRLSAEQRILRDSCRLNCPHETKPLHLGIREIMSNMYTHRITEHRRSLLSNCPNFPRLIEMIQTLPDDKILFITRGDVGVFHHLLSLPCAQPGEMYEYTQKLFEHFLEGLERKLLYRNDLIDLIPLIPPVFGYLFKSYSEIAGEIVSKSDALRFQDMLLIDSDRTWRLNSEISFAIEHKASQESILYCESLKIQYYAVGQMLNSFSPGAYNKEKRITDELYILSEPVETEGLSNERLVWLVILAKSIPSQNFLDTTAVKLYDPLLQCYISFVKKSATDAHESYRVVMHSIVRFLTTTLTFTRQYNDRPVKHDTLFLEQLMSLVIPRISRELEGSTYFRDLIEELNRYWNLCSEIHVKTCHRPAAWRLMEVLVPCVVRPSVCLEVPVINLVRYLRSLNDFVDAFKDIDFERCWYVKSDVYDCTVMEKINNKLSSENCSYRVTNVDGFIKLMKGKTLPKHHIVEIVGEMITYIKFPLANWCSNETLANLTPNEKEAKAIEMAVSIEMLLDIMKQSFFQLKEQPEYFDFLTFKKEILEPPNRFFKSWCFNENENRMNMVKESFIHIRSLNEIGIEQAIALFENVNGCSISDKLSDAYNSYWIHFNSTIQTYSQCIWAGSSHEESLATVIRTMKMPSHVHFSNWTEDFKTKGIPILLALVSAVWSIRMSGGVSNSEKFLKPHCIQILCVLRLLSVDKPKGAENHLSQVSAGHGKSMILGLLSSVLALTGHKVRIVCCSKYLSTRDENNFKEFFQHFGIDNAIRYGTIEDMANGFLNPLCNGSRTSLRKMVRDKVLHHADWASLGSVKTESSETVLLIDDVDLSFNDPSCGNHYNSLTKVQISGLGPIQLEMWKIAKGSPEDADRVKWLTDIHIQENINMRNPLYMEWDAFCREPGTFHLLVDDASGKCRIKEYTNRSLVDEHLMMMSKDAILLGRSNKMDHLFRLNDVGLICMKTSAGQYLHTTVQSYQNTFAYLKLIGPARLLENRSLNFGYLLLKTGKISYPRLPCQFPLILGVSGTLTYFTEYEKKWIGSYIKEFSIVPSLFGESRLKFNADLDFKLVYKPCDWLTHIYQKVNEIVQSARAALVFFDTDEKLNLFADEYKTKVRRVNEITLNTDRELRDRYIAEAGVSGTVTLTTPAMGCGVDYKASEAVEKLGGIHVIQTFFSLDVKEEIRIRGRTARQDGEGSYELIVCKEHLVHLRITLDYESEHKYATLQKIRREFMQELGKRHTDIVNKSEHDHEMTMMYYGMAQFDKTLSDDSIALGNYWKSPGAQ